MKKACDRRERDEHERLATIFRDPNSLVSPSGRRQRPSLIDLRKPCDVRKIRLELSAPLKRGMLALRGDARF